MITSKINRWRSISLFVALGSVLSFSACEDDVNPPMVPERETIVDVASDNPDFSTLVAAVEEAGLVDALSGAGPLTVFAPTNDAFTEFLSDNNLTAAQLLANPDLADILTYHVVNGAVGSADVNPGPVTALNER